MAALIPSSSPTGLTIKASERALPFVSVIVPTYRRRLSLMRALMALGAQHYPPEQLEIVVVDDDDDPATAALVAAVGGSSVRYVAQAQRGAAAARNKGARIARGDLLLFVDDDILLPPNGVSAFVASFDRIGVCCLNGRWDFPDEMSAELSGTPFGRFRLELEDWVKRGMPMHVIDERYAEVALLTACNLLVRRDAFWGIGGFDESIPSAGYEDQEFSLRARDKGYRLIYDRTLRCLHDDRRLSRDAFLERQRRGAMTAAILYRRRPEHFAERDLIRENDAIRLGEPVRRTLKKLLKATLAFPPLLAGLRSLATLFERAAPRSRVLTRLYWGLVGVYLFRGVRDGLAGRIA